jgi:hypothetical protein
LAMTTEGLKKHIVTFLPFIVEVSHLTRHARAGVYGTMPAEHLLPLSRRLPAIGQTGEALEEPSNWLLPVSSAESTCVWPACLDHRRKRELYAGVPCLPLPRGFVGVPFAVTLALVQGAMRAVGAPLAS